MTQIYNSTVGYGLDCKTVMLCRESLAVDLFSGLGVRMCCSNRIWSACTGQQFKYEYSSRCTCKPNY